IHVPPSQIIDTVDLYYIASRQRKLSLRLLSYLILRHDIQNAGNFMIRSKTHGQHYSYMILYRQFEQ
ncbi:poly(A)-specific ribonuclease, partial [Puccinia graminis f. sp. tritici]